MIRFQVLGHRLWLPNNMAVELQNYGRMLRVPIISITIFSFDEGQEILESLHADPFA